MMVESLEGQRRTGGGGVNNENGKKKNAQVRVVYFFSGYFSFPFSIDIIVTFHIIGTRARGRNIGTSIVLVRG